MRANFNAQFSYLAGHGNPYLCKIMHQRVWYFGRGRSYEDALTDALGKIERWIHGDDNT